MFGCDRRALRYLRDRLIPMGLVNHTVRIPRRINAASYSGQFVTRYLALGTLWRRLSLNLYGISFHNERLGWTGYPSHGPVSGLVIHPSPLTERLRTRIGGTPMRQGVNASLATPAAEPRRVPVAA
jgi:hypothetical protein